MSVISSLHVAFLAENVNLYSKETIVIPEEVRESSKYKSPYAGGGLCAVAAGVLVMIVIVGILSEFLGWSEVGMPKRMSLGEVFGIPGCWLAVCGGPLLFLAVVSKVTRSLSDLEEDTEGDQPGSGRMSPEESRKAKGIATFWWME